MRGDLLQSIRDRLGVRSEQGQVIVLISVTMLSLCALGGFTIDVGSWYQIHRKQQAIADASALAAAQDLPASTSQALADAQSYATKNGGALAAGDVTFSSKYVANDTVTVNARTVAPTYFLKALGVESTHVVATSVARAVPIGKPWGASPLAVNSQQNELSGPGCPCFGVSTTLQYNQVGPGGFEIINIDGSSGGTGQSTLADWLLNGCSCSTDTPQWLWNDAGAKYNSNEVNDALTQRIGSTLLFPVYDQSQANGSNMQYRVIAFVGFKVTGFQFNGSKNGSITGYFVKANWKGDSSSSNPGAYTATTIRLVDPSA